MSLCHVVSASSLTLLPETFDLGLSQSAQKWVAMLVPEQ
jgi:hypothetical protein